MRRLVVFSDPGGAKPCLSLAKAWQESDDLLVCSDRRYSFFEIFGIPVNKCTSESVNIILEKFRPDLLFTGTSYTSCIELHFVSESKKRGIQTASFVDHYTGFDVRFGTAKARILPDEIHVIDEKAAALARGLGVPDSCIRIVGNPYHEFLRNWTSRLTREEIYQRLLIAPPKRKTILFAPDPLSNDGGAAKYGTDEAFILALFLEVLGEVGKPTQLLIKAHPNQSIDYLKTGLIAIPLSTEVHLLTSETDDVLNDLIQHVDLVVGMFSSLLIEAEILGAKTLRIVCGLTFPDPFAGDGAGRVLRERTQIASELQNIFINDD